MTYVEMALDVLAEAQRRIGLLIAQAVDKQEFSEVAGLAAIAEGVKAIHGQPVLPGNGTQSSSLASEDGSGNPKPGYPHSGPTSGKPTYPRFERERDRLVKIGWSKRDRRTYEHRAPREVIAAVTGALSQHAGNGRIFTVEQVLPVRLPSGADAPSYQVYMALALLRSVGALRRHGKDGYSLQNGSINQDGLDQIWNSLDEHK